MAVTPPHIYPPTCPITYISGLSGSNERSSATVMCTAYPLPPTLRLEKVGRRLLDRIECEDPTVTTRHPTAVKLDELTHRERLHHGRPDGDDGELDTPRGLQRVAGLLQNVHRAAVDGGDRVHVHEDGARRRQPTLAVADHREEGVRDHLDRVAHLRCVRVEERRLQTEQRQAVGRIAGHERGELRRLRAAAAGVAATERRVLHLVQSLERGRAHLPHSLVLELHHGRRLLRGEDVPIDVLVLAGLARGCDLQRGVREGGVVDDEQYADDERSEQPSVDADDERAEEGHEP